MKRFEFNLQSVRDLRDSEESRARAEYAQAMRLMEAFNIRRREIEQAIEDNLKECREECGRPTRSDLLTSLRDMLVALKDRIKALEPEEAELKKLVASKWENLVAARQKREALDKLRDKQKRAHDQHSERREQKDIDEMATQRASSRKLPYMT
jgi:flagellar export protein FliJ